MSCEARRIPAEGELFFLDFYLYTAATKSGFVTSTDGVKIHYIEAGKGTAILFVPGFTAPGWMCEKQINHFAEMHGVVAMDPRAQGESSQAAEGLYPVARAGGIKAVVDQLKLALMGSGRLVNGSS